jgi:uncharacterized protein
MSIFSIALLTLGASQIYWGWRIYRFLAARIRSRAALWSVCGVLLAIYFVEYQYNLGAWRDRSTPVHLTVPEALLAAPFLWWAASSLFAFIVVLLFAIPRGIRGGVRWLIGRRRLKPEIESPARRDLLVTAANVCAAAPFVAGSYGLLYGRLNLETVQQPIHLPRLPRAFDGFRICQLSDIHIGPFMPAEEIRKYVAIANAQKPDLIVLTGDYVTFDPGTQSAVVDALRGLRAPFGVYGSLGNHDAWAGVEDSITELFRRVGVRILRAENAAIRSGADSINLIGVDFQSARRFGPSPPVKNLLGNIEALVDPHRVNILLSHNPDTFGRAAQIGIDFSLAGHTHGGQAALEFISPEIAPSRFVTPYVAGLFQKPGSQLYVNRGIGTIFIPIRIGAPPELTVYKLVA